MDPLRGNRHCDVAVAFEERLGADDGESDQMVLSVEAQRVTLRGLVSLRGGENSRIRCLRIRGQIRWRWREVWT